MVARYLRKLGALCLLWPWHVLAFFSVLTLGALPLVVRLPLEADLHETLPRDTVQALERHIRLFGNSDQAFLLVQTEERSKADLIAFGEALAHKLIPSPLIRQVEFGYSPPLLKVLQDMALDYAPLFVGPEQLESFDRLLTPQGMRAQIRKTLLELSSLGSEVRDRALQEDPLQLRRFAFARLAAWRGSFRFDAFSAYFLSQDGKALLIKIEGQASVDDLEGVKATVGLLRQASQELLSRPAFWGLTVQGTGGYFLAVESDSIIRRDLIRSMAVAVVLICVLIAWSFRRWGVLLYGQIPTLVGLFIALGVFALARPKINALTLGCSVPLVGLGIDFTIHILTQCFAELGQGRTKQEAIQSAVRETGGALLLAAITTIAAFAAFLFSIQRFLQDMGLLAVLGIFFCFLLCLIFLPSLMVCLPANNRCPAPRAMGIPHLIRLTLKAPTLVLGLSLALCLGAVAALVWRPPRFETDLRNIHAAASPSLQVQAKIVAMFGGSQEPLTLLLEGTTEEQVIQAMQRLEPALTAMVAEGMLAAVTSPATLFPDTGTQEVVLRRLRKKDPEALTTILAGSLEDAGFDLTMLKDYMARVHHALALRAPLDLSTLRTLGFEELLRPFLGHDDAGAAGLVVLFPKKELWTFTDRSAVSQRISEMLSRLGLQGTLTGLYTVSSESAARVGADFRRITLLALAFIGTVVFLWFHHPRTVGLVFLPVGCGALWTAGLFALFDLKLNFMNIAILPMLLGIGIDDGIHIVHHFRTHGSWDVQEALRFTGTAVCLSSLTTLLAFGTLVLSANRGIASVGFVSLIGVTACLLASIFTLPAALKVWEERRTKA